MIINKLLLLVSIVFLAACSSNEKPPMTPLQIQTMQSREFDTNQDVAFRSVLSVFQDLGYIVNSANKETGFITAESAATSEGVSWWSETSVVTQTKATATVEQIGTRSLVRLNFVISNKTSYEEGQTDRNDKSILDSKAYEYAFERIGTAIFVRSGSK